MCFDHVRWGIGHPAIPVWIGVSWVCAGEGSEGRPWGQVGRGPQCWAGRVPPGQELALCLNTERASVPSLRPRELASLQTRLQGVQASPPLSPQVTLELAGCFLSLFHFLNLLHSQ